MATIADIEGIGAVNARKLNKAGIRSVAGLLKAGATVKGRAEIEAATGIPHSKILEWVNHADLYRVRGVGSEYSDLLEEAGVDTVAELAKRKPAALHATLVKTNTEKKIVRQVPSMTQVESWVTEAKGLPRIVKY